MLKVGDVVLTRSHFRLSKLIAYFSTEPGEKKAYWTHAALVIWPGDLHHSRVIEAQSPRVRIVPTEITIHGKSWVVWRKLGLSPSDADRLKSIAMQDLGRRYPIPKLILHFLDWGMEQITGKDWGFFARLGKYGPRKECSVLVSTPWSYLGEFFAKQSPEEVKPGDINDALQKDPTWIKVAEVIVP